GLLHFEVTVNLSMLRFGVDAKLRLGRQVQRYFAVVGLKQMLAIGQAAAKEDAAIGGVGVDDGSVRLDVDVAVARFEDQLAGPASNQELAVAGGQVQLAFAFLYLHGTVGGLG